VDLAAAENKEKFYHSKENDVRYFLEILGLEEEKINKIVEIIKE